MSSDFRVSGSPDSPRLFVSAGFMEDLYTDTSPNEPVSAGIVGDLYGDISDEENLSLVKAQIKALFPDKAYTGKTEVYDFNSKELFVAHRSYLTTAVMKIDRVFNSSTLPEEFIPEGLTLQNQLIYLFGDAENIYQNGMQFHNEACNSDVWARKKAFISFQKAAFNGHAGAACMLGKYYLHDWVVDQSTEKARSCFLHAAAKNNAEAFYILGILREQKLGNGNFDLEAFACFMRAGELGHVDALLRIAQICDFGFFSAVRGSDSQAFIHYKKAAEMGNRRAQFKTAEMLEEGRGVLKSTSEAYSWYERAAENGDYLAQFKTVEKYALGIGVERSEQKAAEWKERALASKAADDALYG
jgi:TPR repeat protein